PLHCLSQRLPHVNCLDVPTPARALKQHHLFFNQGFKPFTPRKRGLEKNVNRLTRAVYPIPGGLHLLHSWRNI
ncbi:hypothetical protein, partial [Klebsiella pneumoniae]|uniref:hypothetical protein n=1 Tax=Klebsiella pneumoniae TaxID=573 RepID=UPI0030DD723F